MPFYFAGNVQKVLFAAKLNSLKDLKKIWRFFLIVLKIGKQQQNYLVKLFLWQEYVMYLINR